MKHLKIGDIAPGFSLPDQNGNTVNLKDFKGKKVILFFYPKANTPGCTAEACNLQDNYKLLEGKGFQILGASADPVDKQKKFADKFGFTYPLLSDTEKTLLNDYGVWGLKKFMGREYDGIHRTTFIIDESGKIEKIIEKVKTKDHAQQILDLY